MTPQEKAENLVLEFLFMKNEPQDYGWSVMNKYLACKCAKKVCEEMIDELIKHQLLPKSNVRVKYWQTALTSIDSL